MELIFGHTDGRMDGWTDKHGSRNSYLDKAKKNCCHAKHKINWYLNPYFLFEEQI